MSQRANAVRFPSEERHHAFFGLLRPAARRRFLLQPALIGVDRGADEILQRSLIDLVAIEKLASPCNRAPVRRQVLRGVQRQGKNRVGRI